MKVAMVSAHASPLAPGSGSRASGQSVHVAEISAALARRGHEVTVYTRRDDPGSPQRMLTSSGYTVVHVDAGPAAPLSGDQVTGILWRFQTLSRPMVERRGA